MRWVPRGRRARNAAYAGEREVVVPQYLSSDSSSSSSSSSNGRQAPPRELRRTHPNTPKHPSSTKGSRWTRTPVVCGWIIYIPLSVNADLLHALYIAHCTPYCSQPGPKCFPVYVQRIKPTPFCEHSNAASTAVSTRSSRGTIQARRLDIHYY